MRAFNSSGVPTESTEANIYFQIGMVQCKWKMFTLWHQCTKGIFCTTDNEMPLLTGVRYLTLSESESQSELFIDETPTRYSLGHTTERLVP